MCFNIVSLYKHMFFEIKSFHITYRFVFIPTSDILITIDKSIRCYNNKIVPLYDPAICKIYHNVRNIL